MSCEGSLWSPLDPRESLLFIIWVADKNEISPSQAADRITGPSFSTQKSQSSALLVQVIHRSDRDLMPLGQRSQRRENSSNLRCLVAILGWPEIIHDRIDDQELGLGMIREELILC